MRESVLAYMCVCVRAYTKLSRRKGDVIMIQLHEDMQIEITKRLHITFLLLFILSLLTCYIMTMIMLDGILDLVTEFMKSKKIIIMNLAHPLHEQIEYHFFN